jgi:DNA repair protein RecN (Recombination protein N)
MLTRLHIRNLAVVDELELEFRAGMTVFTGETGAGKSILIDAIGLVLGDRADSNVIRGGEVRCEVSAAFEIGNRRDVAELLREQDIESADGEILVRRTVDRDGRGRAWINGSAVPVNVLRAIGEQLVDVHGQHEHQSLFRRDMQREMLDACGGCAPELDAVRADHAAWQDAVRRLAELARGGADHESQLELLRAHIAELDALAARPGEFEALEEQRKRLAHAGDLLESMQGLLAALYEEEESAHSRIGAAARRLTELQRLDAGLAPIGELLNNASIQIDEAASAMRDYLHRLDLDPERRQQIEERLDTMHDLARKHRTSPGQLPATLELLEMRRADLESGSALVETLTRRRDEALKNYAQHAAVLRRKREQAAANLAQAVSAELRRLGMPDGKFQVELGALPAEPPLPSGTEQAEFQVTLNPGQPLRPLAKVASGGELSRIGLAIAVVANRGTDVATLIFDEVDAGIGGAIAEVVGRLLHTLAKHSQVICVTHLPQVAAQGDHHFQVEKSVNRKQTQAAVRDLQRAERIEEIARMLGGVTISAKTRAHAEEMLGKG